MIKKEWLFMQTPKEKANRLVKAFYSITTTSTKAKQCAKQHITLILESEILKPSNNSNYTILSRSTKRNRKAMMTDKDYTRILILVFKVGIVAFAIGVLTGYFIFN